MKGGNKMKKDNKAIIITSIISGVILIIALLALSVLNPASSQKNSVTVQGLAEVQVEPDLMGIYFNIQTTGNTSSKAKDENNEIYNNLVSELSIDGFDQSRLKTQSFNVYPNYVWEDDERIENGYQASHSLKLELSSDEFNKVTEVIDAGVDSGSGISYINYELSQESQSEYKAQALELASKDAKVKAEAVASGFNKKVGKLVSVQVNDFGYYPWVAYSGGYEDGAVASVAKESVAEFNPSEQSVNARVSATYKLR